MADRSSKANPIKPVERPKEEPKFTTIPKTCQVSHREGTVTHVCSNPTRFRIRRANGEVLYVCAEHNFADAVSRFDVPDDIRSMPISKN